MRNEEVVTLIEQYGYLHGDHYSFNTREFCSGLPKAVSQ